MGNACIQTNFLLKKRNCEQQAARSCPSALERHGLPVAHARSESPEINRYIPLGLALEGLCSKSTRTPGWALVIICLQDQAVPVSGIMVDIP